MREKRFYEMEHVTAPCALRAFAADLAVSNKQDWTHQICGLIELFVARVVQRELALRLIASLSCPKLHAASVHWCCCEASKPSSVSGIVVLI